MGEAGHLRLGHVESRRLGAPAAGVGGGRLPAPAASAVGVLEVGGTHVTAALVTPAGWRVVEGSLRRAALEPAGSAHELVAALTGAAAAVGAPPGLPWGVAVPGPFDYRAGVAAYEGVGKFDALAGHDLRSPLAAAAATAPEAVGFVNDAEAFLLGEWLTGAAAGARRCAALTLGTGVGSAFLADGAVVADGPHVPPGGSVHRLTVDGVALEDLVSRRAVLARFAAGGGRSDADVREVAALAHGGDAWAGRVIDDAMGVLGRAVAPWLVAFGTDVLVVGGSISRSWDVVVPPLARALSEAGAAGVRPRPAADLDGAALTGAAWAALGRPG